MPLDRTGTQPAQCTAMRSHSWLFSMLCALVVMGSACSEDNDTPTAPSPGDGPGGYTAIGASDAVGAGGSVPCAPFDLGCQNGTGYVQQIARRLRGQLGAGLAFDNLGTPGGVLSPTMSALGSEFNRVALNFIERQAPFVPPASTYVTIFAGGNDANIIGEAVRAGRAGNDIRGYIDQHVRQWGSDYETLIDRVRGRAARARVVVFNLPNLGVAPYMAGATALERSIMQRIAVGLADRANALAARGVLVVDLLCEPRIYNAANFSSDGFHPSDQGYTLMADLATPVLLAGSAAPPSASCAQRTLLPVF